MIARTPEPPYYSVIFTSLKNDNDDGYEDMAARMLRSASAQDGFLGFESARSDLGISVSYWRDPESIRRWKEHTLHLEAQRQGKKSWYKSYKVRIARVERDYGFNL